MFLVNARHQGSGRRQHLIDEDEDGLLWRQLDALADDVDELADRQVCGNEILLLVDGCDLRLLDLLADDLGSGQLENNEMTVKWDDLTGIRSLYFARIRSASALRFANSCSSLNLERILVVWLSGYGSMN